MAVSVVSLVASAQQSPDQPSEADTDSTPSDVVPAEGTVGVDDTPRDKQIEERLTEILEASERFPDFDVDVKDAVVFIDGTALSSADRELASDLASRTEGVAAVVNNLELPDTPLWTLEPTFDELRELSGTLIRAIPLLVAGLLVLVVTILLGRLVSGISARFIAGRTNSELLRNVLRKAVFLAIVLTGFYIALRITGLTRVALTVVSGTGLLGLALGFAFRDIAENFLASILLSIQRPFRLGDVVEVDGHTGIIRKVTSRGTLLIDFDGNHIQIANATVYKNTIKNYTANPLVRINFVVGIGYDTVITHAQDVAHRVLEDHPAVLDDPEPLVLVEELGSSTVNLRVYFWINGAEHSMLKMQSSVIRLTVRALADAGVSMPDDAREVIFPDGVPVQLDRSIDAATVSTSPGPSAVRPSPSPARSPVTQSDDVVVEAEGDLTSETHDLEMQAERSRDPEEGANVLTNGGSS